MNQFNKKYIQKSNSSQSNPLNKEDSVKNIYYGEVTSIFDEDAGGRIRVRIDGLDTNIPNENLVYCYPLLPRFIHLIPKVGEVVRIFIPDPRYNKRSRFWMGSVISQPQKIKYDNKYTALSTTNDATSEPEAAPSTNPNAEGIYPNIEDIGLIGRDNTDILLREREVEIRAGKHELNDNLTLNKTNPASIKLSFDLTGTTTSQKNSISSNVVMADRIALISHDGIPKFKAAQLTSEDREKIFSQGNPLPRGNKVVEALELLRQAVLEHIHGYSGLEPDRSGAITDLEKIDFTQILQRNIVIN